MPSLYVIVREGSKVRVGASTGSVHLKRIRVFNQAVEKPLGGRHWSMMWSHMHTPISKSRLGLAPLLQRFQGIENVYEISSGCLLHIQGVLYIIISVWKKVHSISPLSPAGREYCCTHS